MAVRSSEHDVRLSARVTTRSPLLYAAGACADSDRPVHIRAASGLTWLGDQLAVVQDDANFIALVRPGDEHAAEVLALPAGPAGLRQFDDRRGNKAHKLDLEAAFTTSIDGREALVAFGSGATPARRRALLVTGEPLTAVVVDADELYLAIVDIAELAGSELNLEGAALLPDGRVRFLQRGNGAAARGLSPVDASWDAPLAELVAYLCGRGDAPRPRAGDVVQYELGAMAGCRLTFTDAAWSRGAGRLFFLAAAERSPDAVRDGEVVGSVVGVFDEVDGGGSLRHAVLTDAAGAAIAVKAEGIAFDAAVGELSALVALDADDPAAPSELCRVVLEGPWV